MSRLFLSLEARVGMRQQQMLTVGMQQALYVLQLPVLELAEWLQAEIEQNPVLTTEEENEGEENAVEPAEQAELDFEENSFEALEALDSREFFGEIEGPKREPEAFYRPSLFEHLMEQARLAFRTGEELKQAEWIIGNLDERGFFTGAEASAVILEKIQSFDPPGIAARSLQESLLIQLRLKGKAEELAYRVVEKHFEDLIHNRLPLVQKSLGCTPEELKAAIHEEIASLNLQPAGCLPSSPLPSLTADLILTKEDESWSVEINDEWLPKFRLVEGASDGKYLAAARWLRRNLEKRQATLKAIAHYLIKTQGAYLSGDSQDLLPMTMEEVGKAVGLHESTIARAVAHKYLSCPRGLVSMRSFFTAALAEGVSNQAVKHLLEQIIADENKSRPLSDQALSLKIAQKGIPCARRTVTKYRCALKIPSASQRRQW
jgi:RNA polymerase sigma-54 factor